MALQDLIDKDAAAKAATGKRDGEIPCKLPEPSVNLSAHTPTSEWEQINSKWRLTQAGAARVHSELVRQRIEGEAPPAAGGGFIWEDGNNAIWEDGNNAVWET